MAIKKCPSSSATPDKPKGSLRRFPEVHIIDDTFTRYDESLRTISLKIHKYKELSFEEHRSARLLCDFLEREGFHVERGVAGDATAFLATYAQFQGPIVSFNSARLPLNKADSRNTMRFLILATVVDITSSPYALWGPLWPRRRGCKKTRPVPEPSNCLGPLYYQIAPNL